MRRERIASGTQMIERKRIPRTEPCVEKRGSRRASVVKIGSPVSKTRRTAVCEGRISSSSSAPRSIPNMAVNSSRPVTSSRIITKPRCAFITSTAVSRTRRSTTSTSSEELTVSATRPIVAARRPSRSALASAAANLLAIAVRSSSSASYDCATSSTEACSAASPTATARSRKAARAAARTWSRDSGALTLSALPHLAATTRSHRTASVPAWASNAEL